MPRNRSSGGCPDRLFRAAGSAVCLSARKESGTGEEGEEEGREGQERKSGIESAVVPGPDELQVPDVQGQGRDIEEMPEAEGRDA